MDVAGRYRVSRGRAGVDGRPRLAGVELFDFGVVLHALEFTHEHRALKILDATTQAGAGGIRGHDIAARLASRIVGMLRCQGCHGQSSGFDGFAVSTHEHALVEQALEGAQSTRLVQTAFVAAHAGGRMPRATEWRPSSFGFVAKSVAGDLGGFVSAHACNFRSCG